MKPPQAPDRVRVLAARCEDHADPRWPPEVPVACGGHDGRLCVVFGRGPLVDLVIDALSSERKRGGHAFAPVEAAIVARLVVRLLRHHSYDAVRLIVRAGAGAQTLAALGEPPDETLDAA